MVNLEAPHIGIFDSGIGGLSVLRTLRQQLPQADIRYLADARYTPWGDRSAPWVQARSLQLCAYLIDAGADLVLVACNTASTLAIAALRARWPGRLFVAVEPGVKPAAATSRSGRIAVLGTSATLNSARFGQLVEAHAPDTTLLRLPCPGLADAIERMGSSASADQQLDARLDALVGTLKDAGVDTVVLACTHYPLVAPALAQRLGPGVALLDTADAVVQQVLSLLGRSGSAPPADPSTTRRPDLPWFCPLRQISQTSKMPQMPRLLSTGAPEGLQRAARRWIDPDADAAWLDLPDLA